MAFGKVQAITFDLDDTLWAIAPVIENAEQALHNFLSEHCPRVADRFHLEAMRELREQVGLDFPDMAHDFSWLRLRALELAVDECGYPAEVAQQAFDAFFAARQQVSLYPDVLPTLTRLRDDGYRLAGLTNGNADVEKIGLSSHFEFNLNARSHGKPKPHRRIFDAAVKALDLKPGLVLHIGDHPEHDVFGAREAGMQGLWLNRHDHEWPGPEPGPAQIASLSELPPLLEANS